MHSRFSQSLILIGAILAFLPILGVDIVLDHYIRDQEGKRLHRDIESVAMETQSAVYDGISSLREVLNDSPSLCAPTFIANAQKQMQSNIFLRQMLVENTDGVQYCDVFGQTLNYSALSRELAIPGTDEILQVVRFEGEQIPVLKIIHRVGTKRTVSAFVYISPRLLNGMPSEFALAAFLKLSLTDGTDVQSFGETSLLNGLDGISDDYLYQNVIADALPLKVEAAVPMSVMRQEYQSLDLVATTVAAMTCAIFLLLAIYFLRQVRIGGINLERAIARGELMPYYQPVMDISNGSLTGCEVLVRWKKNGKTIPPNEFIDYAETSGLAIPMTIRLMEQIVADLSELCAAQPELKIGINLFDGHFKDTMIVDDVQAIFGGTPINFRQLMFEITERRPLEDSLAVEGVIGGLHALGCKIAMDDAGTGYSNLKTVQTLGIDVVKIDKVFVELIEPDTTNAPVLDALITMAKDLGMGIIAEGVETEAQALYLRDHGVVSAQGYLFAPALQLDAFLQLAGALGPKAGRGAKDEVVANAELDDDVTGEEAA